MSITRFVFASLLGCYALTGCACVCVLSLCVNVCGMVDFAVQCFWIGSLSLGQLPLNVCVNVKVKLAYENR